MKHTMRVAKLDAQTARVILTRDAYLNALWVTLPIYILGSLMALRLQDEVERNSGLLGLYFLALAVFLGGFGVFFLVPAIFRSGPSHARDRVLAHSWALFCSVYLMANQDLFPDLWNEKPFRMHLMRPSRRRRRLHERWALDTMRTRRVLQSTARQMSRQMSICSAQPDREIASLEARLLLWCSERPAERLEVATQVLAAVGNTFSPEMEVPLGLVKSSSVRLMGIDYDDLPSISRGPVKEWASTGGDFFVPLIAALITASATLAVGLAK